MESKSNSQLSSNKERKITQRFSIYLDKFLGSGTYGQVYLGYDYKQNKLIAVKVAEKLLCQKQAQLLTILNIFNHKNIVGFYGSHKIQSSQSQATKLYLFLEYCQNGDLNKAIQKGIAESQILQFFGDLLSFMGYMHDHCKIIHLDLKPENILIGNDGRLKACDPGLSKIIEQGQSHFSSLNVAYTPLFVGPQIKGKQGYGKSCDVWSAGLVLYQMLTKNSIKNTIKNKSQLKEFWRSFKEGTANLKYPFQYHPMWQYFLNCMLVFDPNSRKSFEYLQKVFSRVHDKMKFEIQQRQKPKQCSIVKITDPKLQQLQNYLQFQHQKYKILTKLATEFKENIFLIHPDKLQAIKFLGIFKYIARMKKLFHHGGSWFNLPNEKIDLSDSTKQIDKIILIDIYRMKQYAQFEVYLKNQLQNILDKLYKEKIQKDIKQQEINKVQGIGKFVYYFKELNHFFKEEDYTNQLKTLVSQLMKGLNNEDIQKLSKEAISYCITIIIAANLDQILPQNEYQDSKIVQDKLKYIYDENHNNPIEKIHKINKIINGSQYLSLIDDIKNFISNFKLF